tara:strand:+ start:192 stop:854 length:663 start_codon:yes stop_codon:yes gene_type:complete
MKIFTFKSKPPLTPFAPQWDYPFGHENISHFIDCPKIASIVLSKEKNIIRKFPPMNRSSIDGYTDLGSNSLTSRYGYYNLIEWPEIEIQILRGRIIEFHKKFLKELNVKISNPFFIKGWANVMRKGEKINPHLHNVQPDAYLSGHITIQCENTSTFYINPVNQLNEPEIKQIKNVPGEITLFPTCVPHYTDTHQALTERITIAFDLSLQTDKAKQTPKGE